MSPDDYIRAVRRNNPRLFGAERIQLRPAELERLLRHAFETGQQPDPPERDGAELPEFMRGLFQ